MVLKCEICKSPMNVFDNVLVCEEGHTIANTLVGNEEDDFVAVGKKMKVSTKKKKIMKMTNLEKTRAFMSTLKVYYSIFQKAKPFFQFNSDKYFKLYTETFSNLLVKPSVEEVLLDIFNNNPLNFYGYEEYFTRYLKSPSNPKILFKKPDRPNKNVPVILTRDCSIKSIDIFTLIYLSKRSEEEENGKIYGFQKFIETLRKFNFFKIVKSLNVNFSEVAINSVTDSPLFYKITAIDRAITRFCNPEYEDVGHKTKSFKFTGVVNKMDEKIYGLFRKYIKTDKKTYLLYMKSILSEIKLGFEVDEKKFYYFFNKFCSVLDPNRIFVPELTFSRFLCYFINEFHIEKFDESAEKISKFLLVEKNIFLNKIETMKDLLNSTETPEKFENFINSRKNDKYEIFEKTIEKIKSILIKNIQENGK